MARCSSRAVRFGKLAPGGLPRQGINMSGNAPPIVFTAARRHAVRRRMLAFLRIEPRRSLVIGDWTNGLAAALAAEVLEPADGFEEDRPLPDSGLDFIASLGTLDTVNDLPGALVHLRSGLAPGGLLIASFLGAGSLPRLRAAMLAADAERPAPRMHPMIDVRAGGQLLQRAGLADPVVDSRTLSVSFRSLGRLVADLRAQGLSSALARGGPPLTRPALVRAREAFWAEGENGRTVERFEILTLSGWRK
jgi:SAM-dependent methyltransferase